MSLVQAIDALLALFASGKDETIEHGSGRRRLFDERDRAVWVEACRAGHESQLPPADGHCLGLTHLPGSTLVNGDFVLTGLNWWRNRLLALRTLAESKPAEEQKAVGEPKPKMAVAVVAERLERLRLQGQRWTSYSQMAVAIGCSSETVHNAVKENAALKAWAKRPKTADPRAQSLNDVVTDRSAQTRELSPDDEAAIREYIENATDEEKAWFLALSVEEQLTFLDGCANEDGPVRIFGRKP